MAKKRELIGLVDMDGTLVDYDSAMKADLAKLASPEETPYAHGGPDDNKPKYIEARIRMIRKQPGWWLRLKPIKQGIEVVDMMASAGYKIHILTKGPVSATNAWTEKVEWCRTNLSKDVSVTITEDKGLVYGAVMFDDWPDYISRWLEWRPRGFVIMPAHPWNKDFSHPNVLRYSATRAERKTLKNKLQMLADIQQRLPGST